MKFGRSTRNNSKINKKIQKAKLIVFVSNSKLVSIQ